jgi:hypothetical protein
MVRGHQAKVIVILILVPISNPKFKGKEKASEGNSIFNVCN